MHLNEKGKKKKHRPYTEEKEEINHSTSYQQVIQLTSWEAEPWYINWLLQNTNAFVANVCATFSFFLGFIVKRDIIGNGILLQSVESPCSLPTSCPPLPAGPESQPLSVPALLSAGQNIWAFSLLFQPQLQSTAVYRLHAGQTQYISVLHIKSEFQSLSCMCRPVILRIQVGS